MTLIINTTIMINHFSLFFYIFVAVGVNILIFVNKSREEPSILLGYILTIFWCITSFFKNVSLSFNFSTTRIKIKWK